MSTNPFAARYVSDSVATATPERLLCMLYDRLVRDVTMAEAAITARNRSGASEQLLHAQDIIAELRSTLDVSVWSGAPALASLYDYLYSELIAANVAQDAAKVAACKAHIVPLQQAWHAAAAELASGRTSELATA
jgi:flagellar secretion chaperone FliS